MRRSNLIAVVVAFAFATVSCSGVDLSGPGPDQSLAENHPAPLDSSSGNGLRWSPDGTEIGYVSPNFRVAYARNVVTGARRELFTAVAGAQIASIEFSSTPSQWFTVSTRPNEAGTVIRRHTATGVEVIATRSVFTNLVGQHLVRAAHNGDFAYIVWPDSMFIRRAGAPAAQFISTGCVGIGAVSPASTDVLCLDAANLGEVRSHPVRGGSSAVVFSGREGRFVDASWNVTGLFLLLTDFGGTRYQRQRYLDPSPGYTTPSAAPETGGSISGTLSEDGRSFAYALAFCAQSEGLFGCRKGQATIYVADAVTRTTKRIAVQTGAGYASVVISPDGSRVAYELDRQVYLLPAR